MIRSFADYITHIASYGSSPALSTYDGKIELTYEELASEIKNFGAVLSKQIKVGERIAIIDIDGPYWAIAFFAIVLNKGIAVSIDNRMSEDLKNEILQSVSASRVVTCNTSLKTSVDAVVYERKNIQDAKDWIPQNIGPDDPVQILYTSGTWGKPKGVVLTQNNLISNLLSIVEIYQPSKNEKLLSVLPLAHAYEQMVGLFVPLYSGCHIIYQKALDSFSLLSSLQKFQPDYMIVVPKFLEIIQASILKSASKKKILLLLMKSSQYLPVSAKRKIFNGIHKKFGGNLKTFIVGGAPLNKEIEAFFRQLGFNLFIGYGLSESSPVLTFSKDTKSTNSVGFPIPNVSIKIAEDGEVIASGPNISPGYWPLSNKTNGDVLNTGDIGHLDKSGRLILTGRKKNMIVFSTGDKIQLEDIENIANKFPGIKETCAVAISEKDKPKIGIVYVGQVNEDEYLKYVNANVPLFAHTAFVKKWTEDKLPYSHTLKLQRNVILENTLSTMSFK